MLAPFVVKAHATGAEVRMTQVGVELPEELKRARERHVLFDVEVEAVNGVVFKDLQEGWVVGVKLFLTVSYLGEQSGEETKRTDVRSETLVAACSSTAHHHHDLDSSLLKLLDFRPEEVVVAIARGMVIQRDISRILIDVKGRQDDMGDFGVLLQERQEGHLRAVFVLERLHVDHIARSRVTGSSRRQGRSIDSRQRASKAKQHRQGKREESKVSQHLGNSRLLSM